MLAFDYLVSKGPHNYVILDGTIHFQVTRETDNFDCIPDVLFDDGPMTRNHFL